MNTHNLLLRNTMTNITKVAMSYSKTNLVHAPTFECKMIQYYPNVSTSEMILRINTIAWLR